MERPITGWKLLLQVKWIFFTSSVWKESAKNNKPVLVLVGADDEAFYAEKFEAVFSKNAPHALVKIIPKVKHLNLPNNEDTINIMSSWINSTYQGHWEYAQSGDVHFPTFNVIALASIAAKMSMYLSSFRQLIPF